MPTNIFVNMPVKDLEKSKAFFLALGFSFNPQFTNDDAAALVIYDNIFSMLVTEKFFQRFTNKPIADAKQVTEMIVALSVDSREAVDDMIAKAVAAGGRESDYKDEYEWMHGRGFHDLDGHMWEVLWMDLSKAGQA